MTTHEVLVRARPLIEREENWCQGYEAVTASGVGLDGDGGDRGALDPDAVRFCAAGALIRGAGPERLDHDTEQKPLYRILLRAAGAQKHPDDWSIGPWNDSVTHAEVLAAFDKAIAATAPMPADPFPQPDPEDVWELVPA